MGSDVEKVPTITGQLQKLAGEDPNKAAFIFWDKNHKRTVFTRLEVLDKSMRCAAMLRRLGVRKGDVVCNTLVNSRERVISSFGTILAGAVTMQGQKFLSDGEDILMNLRDSQCRFIIIDHNDTELAGILDRIKSKDTFTGANVYQGLPFLTSIIPVIVGDRPASWLQQLNQQTDSFIEENLTPDDIVYIFVTSGSTGFAKLVPHTSRTLYYMGLQRGPCYSLPLPDGVYFSVSSLGWIGGSPVGQIFLGVTRIIMDYGNGAPINRPATILHVLENEECHSLAVLPSELHALLDILDEKGQHSINRLIKCIGIGGCPIMKASMEAIGRLSENISVSYGSTEADFTAYMIVCDPETYETACVGYPAEGVKFKILDTNLKEALPGTLGEIFVQSPTCAKQYVNNPEASKDTFLEDGWHRTSDIGYINNRDQLFVLGRQSNNINHQGFIHYTGWFEARLDKHPNIKASVILGVPDMVNHEELCVCVIPTPRVNLDTNQIREICKGLFITGDDDIITPIPKYCFLFDEFPVNSNGKIDIKQLKELVMNRVVENNSKNC